MELDAWARRAKMKNSLRRWGTASFCIAISLGFMLYATHKGGNRENNSFYKENLIELAERNLVYNELSKKLNTDGDDLTSHEEWASQYRILDLHYDVHRSNPFEDLSIEQMRFALTYQKVKSLNLQIKPKVLPRRIR